VPARWRPRQGSNRDEILNRLLSTLRRMLNIAQREAWIERNPFNAGDPLISVANEKKRTRILSREEETRLLTAFENQARASSTITICARTTLGRNSLSLLVETMFKYQPTHRLYVRSRVPCPTMRRRPRLDVAGL
jgi:hypothetical protein